MQNRTGRVLAMVGGRSFELSRFNRTTQAMRQLGSTFKPIVYATAIDRGFTPVSILQDSPASWSAGAGQPLYEPLNYDKKFEGPITLRHGLEQSRNVPTVRLMESLGPNMVAAYAAKLGFTSKVQPYLSSALGSSEATLQEVVSAFAVFPNQGVRVTPFEIVRVADRQGNVLEENRPTSTEALRADTAFVMTHLLRGVVERGTAARAASLKWPLGGKTGTTDDFTDAWFIGFDPDITIGVWIGYDRKKSLGNGESGAQAALPIWMDIMKTWIGDRKTPPEFAVPANVVFLPIDRHTGAPVEAGRGVRAEGSLHLGHPARRRLRQSIVAAVSRVGRAARCRCPDRRLSGGPAVQDLRRLSDRGRPLHHAPRDAGRRPRRQRPGPRRRGPDHALAAPRRRRALRRSMRWSRCAAATSRSTAPLAREIDALLAAHLAAVGCAPTADERAELRRAIEGALRRSQGHADGTAQTKVLKVSSVQFDR